MVKNWVLGEVLSVFSVMTELDNTLADVQEVDCPKIRSFPTPLWYLFESEVDIAKECVPDVMGILVTSV